ncbi:hypothetical protein LX36DRAFT_487698 [Colletotrichum falcatum]|nr:hypothetical protein LX36DRAFT_487698 [Colletotrichum falcatum]
MCGRGSASRPARQAANLWFHSTKSHPCVILWSRIRSRLDSRKETGRRWASYNAVELELYPPMTYLRFQSSHLRPRVAQLASIVFYPSIVLLFTSLVTLATR